MENRQYELIKNEKNMKIAMQNSAKMNENANKFTME